MKKTFWLALYLVTSLSLLLHLLLTGGRYWIFRPAGWGNQALWPYLTQFNWKPSWSPTEQFIYLLLLPTLFFSWMQLVYLRHAWQRR